MTLNKSAERHTVSNSTRTIIPGAPRTRFAGDDDFHVQVLPDGATWTEAINIDPTSRFVSMQYRRARRTGSRRSRRSGKVPARSSEHSRAIRWSRWTSAETSASTAPGSPVAFAAAGSFKRRAQANALANSASLGIATASIAAGASGAIATAGSLALTTAQWDAIVTGESGGLTAGALYFVDPATPET